jgi:hypothetical protein
MEMEVKEKSPQLFSFSRNQDITIKEICNIASDDFYDHFHLPLSMPASYQSDNMLDIINPLIGMEGKDKWMIQRSATFSSKKV